MWSDGYLTGVTYTAHTLRHLDRTAKHRPKDIVSVAAGSSVSGSAIVSDLSLTLVVQHICSYHEHGLHGCQARVFETNGIEACPAQVVQFLYSGVDFSISHH